MSESIYIIAETAHGRIDPVTHEAIAAAQSLRHDRLVVVVLGSGLVDSAAQLQFESVTEVLVVDSPALALYNADAYLLALEALVKQEAPRLVLWSHSYQTRDYASALAYRFGKDFVGDCERIADTDDGWTLERQVFQGKAAARYALQSAGTSFVSLTVGAFAASELAAAVALPAQRVITPDIDAPALRSQHIEYLEVGEQSVDLTAAECIVAVGRGIKEAANLDLARQLADSLGAELAASRPVCDEGWLPHASQVGSSGQIVKPRLYFALGISGAAQHLVGMRGAAMIIAINKDANAPIFKVADVAVVGDLFEIVPPLIKALDATG